MERGDGAMQRNGPEWTADKGEMRSMDSTSVKIMAMRMEQERELRLHMEVGRQQRELRPRPARSARPVGMLLPWLGSFANRLRPISRPRATRREIQPAATAAD